MSPNDKSSDPAPIRLGLLLVDGFALMSYASLIEPFRAANSLAGQTLYEWAHITLDAGPAHSSSGVAIAADRGLADGAELDCLFVLAAGDPASFRNARCFAWLRAQARRGVAIGGISGGPFLLARAGLLAGYRATIHWEHAEALQEEFPDLALEASLYVVDRGRMTCAGGTAALDLALSLIEQRHGGKLAGEVGEWFIRTEPRAPALAQRRSMVQRHPHAHPALQRMLAAMEARLGEPLDRAGLARQAGLSLRQLERLARADLGMTLGQAQLAMRLEQAREWLRSTRRPVTEIALACGFRSASHFTRSYAARFGQPPSRSPRPGPAPGQLPDQAGTWASSQTGR